jgi:hypothetical protein
MPRIFDCVNSPDKFCYICGNFSIIKLLEITPVNFSKVLLPPLHIKIGIMTQLMKQFVQKPKTFDFLQKKFPGLSDAKIKGGVFCGPDIRSLMKDKKFSLVLSIKEKKAWEAFRDVNENFFGNFKNEDYKNIVKKLMDAIKSLGCRMTVKVHFLNAHVNYFPENLGQFSEEQGERFHQEIKSFEFRCRTTVRQTNELRSL